MTKKFNFINAIILALVFLGCNNSGPNVSEVQVDLELVPFYEEFHSIKPEEIKSKIPELKEKYDDYIEAYSSKVIHVGTTSDENYAENLKSFLEYAPNIEVYERCKEVFNDLPRLKNDIINAYKHYKYYFPKVYVPDIYLHISGFNQSMIADSGLISISIEKYLGANCDFYERLAIPVYLRRKMTPEKIVPDLMKATAYIEFPFNDSIDDVANNIVYQGKVLYFMKHMVPDLNDTILFDYSKKELAWCESNEAEMWASMVENKHVFNSERLVIQKYVGDAPFSYFFGQDSPGRAGTYVGYRIVASYMKAQQATLQELIHESDGHKIIRLSGYRP